VKAYISGALMNAGDLAAARARYESESLTHVQPPAGTPTCRINTRIPSAIPA
jgi:hypothetical protein